MPSRSPSGPRRRPGRGHEGIRLTPRRIAQAAVQEGVHVVGLSILSGSHRERIPEVLRSLREASGARNGSGAPVVPVVVGGIIPESEARELLAAGVARVYTPKDFEITGIVGDIVELVAGWAGVSDLSASVTSLAQGSPRQ